MPPKKKVKVHESTPVLEPEPTQEAQQPVARRIQKKPFSRSLYFSSEIDEQRIRIRRWKINSLHTGLSSTGFLSNDSINLLANLNRLSRTLARFSNKYRALKNLRSLKYDFYQYGQYEKFLMDRLISRCWRLEKLLIYCAEARFPMKPFMKKSLYPHLKDFFFRIKYSKNKASKQVDRLKCLVNCNFWLQQDLVLNTKNLRKFVRYLQGSNANQVIPNIKGVSQSIPLENDILDLSSMNGSQLPNLKILRVEYTISRDLEKPYPSLDFIQKYPQLTTLYVRTRGDIPSFEFLSSLQNLKQLTLDLRYVLALKRPNLLPPIDFLENLKLSCDEGGCSSEDLQDFLASNKNLKSLEVDFPLRDDYIIFHDKIILPLQTLKLTTNTICPGKRTTVIAKLASFLSKQKHLKSLEIRLGDSFFLNEYEILQKGLTSMTCLQHLLWCCYVPNELQDNKLKDLKKTLIQNPQIQRLELDLGKQGILTGKDFSNLLDGLLYLENLKHLTLKGNFLKITPAAMNKFQSFLNSLILKNAATLVLDISGMPEEAKQEIEGTYAKKSGLGWELSSK